MKKRGTITIRIDFSQSNVSIINIDNIGLKPENMERCVDIIKRFAKGNTLFFGFYRTDGNNLTNQEWEKCEKEIPEFFQTHGIYKPLVETIGENIYSGYLTAGSLPLDDETYKIIPWIFHFYLETTLFCPKINWETFVQTYSNYMKNEIDNYIINDYSDFIFTYSDSGDFSIIFNPNLHDINVVYQEILEILSK